MGEVELSKIDRDNAIASFQSGGALGYLSVALTEKLEQQVGKPFHEIFERSYGTSVGVLNATALWPVRDTGEPLHTTQSLRHFYHDNTDSIFEERWWAAGGAIANIGDVENLERVLRGELGDMMLSDFADGLGILVMDADTKDIRILTSEAAALDPTQDFKMVDLLRAAANAPFYFNQSAIYSAAGTKHQFTDAGFGGPDQSPTVYWHLNEIYDQNDLPYFVSIGAGEQSGEYDIEEWSGVSQVRDVLSLQFEISANQAERTMERLMGDRYVEIEVPITGLEMDSSIAQIREFALANAHLFDNDDIERAVASIGRDTMPEDLPQVVIVAHEDDPETRPVARPAFLGM